MIVLKFIRYLCHEILLLFKDKRSFQNKMKHEETIFVGFNKCYSHILFLRISMFALKMKQKKNLRVLKKNETSSF
jgi:hypothetical protein